MVVHSILLEEMADLVEVVEDVLLLLVVQVHQVKVLLVAHH